MHCNNDEYGSYVTIEEAKNACTSDNNCKGVYDHGCDAGAGRFGITLCAITATYQTSTENSCIYQKMEGKFIHAFNANHALIQKNLIPQCYS